MAEAKKKSLRERYKGAVPLTGTEKETFKWDWPGTELKGRFIRLRDGSMGGQLALIDTGSKVEACSAPQQLADALDSIKPGTMVVIEYIGQEPSKNNPANTVKRFDVVSLPD